MTAQEAASKSRDGMAERYDSDGLWWIWKNGEGFRTTLKKDKAGEPLLAKLTTDEIASVNDWQPVKITNPRHRLM